LEKLFENSYAVLIGIGKFQSNEIRPLNTTQNDVNKIEEVLTTHCGYEANNITKIIDENATLRDIRRFFEGDFSNQVGDNDRVTVFYSGHGTTRPPHGREPEERIFCTI